MPRPYLGVDPGLIKDPKTRAIIDEMRPADDERAARVD